MTVWQNQNVVVIGLARSGVAVAKCLHQLGAHVVANDVQRREQCPEATELEQLDIPVICGEHPSDLITDHIDVVVKNPGVPYHIEPIQKAISLQIPVITEVEIAAELIPSSIVGITGSNGKTTTTTLVGEMLRASHLPVHVAGNIGTALTEVAEKVSSSEWVVAELSSFQLKGTMNFHPHVAALLNIYPAHLDYHQSIDDYIDSKAKLFQNQTPTDYAIFNKDSESARQIQSTIRAQTIWFSRTQTVDSGVFVRDNWVWANMPEQGERAILPIDEIVLPGEFNLENALAATAIALCCGGKVSAIRQVLASFRGVEHRLEYVKTLADVAYYNDSKATNPQAATKAIQSFQQPIIWIAGGLDRGIDFSEMVPIMKDQVSLLIAYGESASKLIARAKEAEIASIHADNLLHAVGLAFQKAETGDVVLLSPACASWDQYTSFEERGRMFKQAVHKL